MTRMTIYGGKPTRVRISHYMLCNVYGYGYSYGLSYVYGNGHGNGMVIVQRCLHHARFQYVVSVHIGMTIDS